MFLEAKAQVLTHIAQKKPCQSTSRSMAGHTVLLTMSYHLLPLFIIQGSTMLAVAIWEYTAIVGNGDTSSDACYGTVAVAEQSDAHIGIDMTANQLKLHENISIVGILDLLVPDFALASPAPQAIGARRTRIEGKLCNAILVLHEDEIRIAADVVMTVAHVADLHIIGDKDKVAPPHRV